MRRLVILALSASVALSGCGSIGGGNSSEAGGSGAAAPVKRQAGSWQTKVQILRLEGPDVKPEMRDQMQKMMDMVGNISVCMTPEAVAAEDPGKNLEKQAGGNNCVFDKKNFSGETMEFAGTCTGQGGKKVKMTAKGKNGATEQDITMVIEPLKADGSSEGVMEMRATSKRTGECKPGDFTPPVPGKDGAPKAP